MNICSLSPYDLELNPRRRFPQEYKIILIVSIAIKNSPPIALTLDKQRTGNLRKTLKLLVKILI
jgi:hypothetical protein